MKELIISSSFEVYDSVHELPSEILSLMKEAIEIRKKAYAPYSNFRVGTAILLKNGKIILGSNQENAAYPSGLCAERVAIFQAGAIYPTVEIQAVTISAASDHNPTLKPIPPCGACRQSMHEYEAKQNQEIPVFFMGESGQVYKSNSVSNLLPLSFDKKHL